MATIQQILNEVADRQIRRAFDAMEQEERFFESLKPGDWVEFIASDSWAQFKLIGRAEEGSVQFSTVAGPYNKVRMRVSNNPAKSAGSFLGKLA